MGPYCNYCDQRCFCHFPEGTPREALAAYGTSTIIATCWKGQEFERQKVGWNLNLIKLAIEVEKRCLQVKVHGYPAGSEGRQWRVDELTVRLAKLGYYALYGGGEKSKGHGFWIYDHENKNVKQPANRVDEDGTIHGTGNECFHSYRQAIVLLVRLERARDAKGGDSNATSNN